MSGFEVVGVVLGAIPLIISAVEKYKTTSQKLKYYRQKITLVGELISEPERAAMFYKRFMANSTKRPHDNVRRTILELGIL